MDNQPMISTEAPGTDLVFEPAGLGAPFRLRLSYVTGTDPNIHNFAILMENPDTGAKVSLPFQHVVSTHDIRTNFPEVLASQLIICSRLVRLQLVTKWMSVILCHGKKWFWFRAKAGQQPQLVHPLPLWLQPRHRLPPSQPQLLPSLLLLQWQRL